jgi:hypothetical protein
MRVLSGCSDQITDLCGERSQQADILIDLFGRRWWLLKVFQAGIAVGNAPDAEMPNGIQCVGANCG